jgi:hypothetical protein
MANFLCLLGGGGEETMLLGEESSTEYDHEQEEMNVFGPSFC